jgi:hypothetical protein
MAARELSEDGMTTPAIPADGTLTSPEAVLVPAKRPSGMRST